MIILDEPSALSTWRRVHRVFRTLGTALRRKIASAYLLTGWVQRFSGRPIVVLEEGVVVEQGTHAELMGKNGRYKELYRYQADKFT